jgi:hypothetical protein
MQDVDILFQMLEWVVKGGAGPISQWICERWPWFQSQTSRVRLVLALGVSSVVGASAYVLAVVMLYQPAPTDWRGWLVALVSAAALSSGFSQIIHRLGKRRA